MKGLGDCRKNFTNCKEYWQGSEDHQASDEMRHGLVNHPLGGGAALRVKVSFSAANEIFVSARCMNLFSHNYCIFINMSLCGNKDRLYDL